MISSRTWNRIYEEIDAAQWRTRFARGMEFGSSHGIAVTSDPLALYYQRLERVKKKVGQHFCKALDRERRRYSQSKKG